MSRVWPEVCGPFGVLSLSLDPELCVPPSLWLLVEVKGPAPGVKTSVLRADHVLVIGRDPSAGVVLNGGLVSRRHALVRGYGEGLEVEDTSKHGTLVDGFSLHRTRVQVPNATELMVGCHRLRLRRLG